MKPRTLLILLAFVTALGSFVWFVERDLPGSDERAELAKRVLDFEEDELSRLTLVRGSERTVLIANAAESSEWALAEPLSARADSDAVASLIDQLAGLEKERTLEEGDAAALGLTPPRVELMLESPAGEQRLLFGGEIPASNSMIVATAETGPYYVVARTLWDEVDREHEDWRSRDLFPGERDEIDRLILGHGDQRLVVARRGESFFVEAPLVDRADKGTVSRFLDALAGLEIAEFVGEAGAAGDPYGLSPAWGFIEVVSGDRPAWRLELGGAVDEQESDESRIFARAEGHVYAISDDLSEDLSRPVEEWRSLEWASLQVHEIDRLDLHDAEGSVVLERDGGDWLRDGVAVEYGAVSDLLYAITGTKAEGLDGVEGIGGAPLLTATINPGEAEQVLEVFSPTNDSYPATASDRSPTLSLGGDRVRSILSNLAAVRTAESQDTEPAEDSQPADDESE